jgi:LuxR family maltose regulon positive regulatory protein
MFADGMANVLRAGNVSDAISGAVALADIRTAQGRLRQAKDTLEEGVRLASEHGGALRGTADLYVGLSELYRESDDLETAERYLRTSMELGERTGFLPNGSRWRVAMARIRQARGDLEGALDLHREADRLVASDFFPDVRPAAAVKARLLLSRGKLDEALEWVRQSGLSVDDELRYVREFEHATLARTLLAAGRHDRSYRSAEEATELLNRLLRAAEEGGRTGSEIELSIVLALAHHSRRDGGAALVLLERAMRLAEPEGYVRVFADEGKPMAVLLETAATRGIFPNYVRRLLTAFREGGDSTLTPSKAEPIREALSERERDVLRQLESELSGPDIARELAVSLNTLRTHTKHIYDKLEVNSRRAAVRRAKELGLL